MGYNVFDRHTGLRLGAGSFGTRWGHGAKPDEVRRIIDGYADAGGRRDPEVVAARQHRPAQRPIRLDPTDRQIRSVSPSKGRALLSDHLHAQPPRDADVEAGLLSANAAKLLAVQRRDGTLHVNPGGDLRLEEGDLVVALGSEDQLFASAAMLR
jgi:hypothetical protein